MVRLVISGTSQSAAYSQVFHATSANAASKLVHKKAVSHAIKLGKSAGAMQTLAGIKYDMEAAVREIDQKIAKAEKLGQMSAVANMMLTKMKMTGHLIERIDQRVGNVEIVIGGIFDNDEKPKLVNPVRTLEHDPGG